MNVASCRDLLAATNKFYTTNRIADKDVSEHLDTVLETILPNYLKNYMTLKEFLIESLESKNEFG